MDEKMEELKVFFILANPTSLCMRLLWGCAHCRVTVTSRTHTHTHTARGRGREKEHSLPPCPFLLSRSPEREHLLSRSSERYSPALSGSNLGQL